MANVDKVSVSVFLTLVETASLALATLINIYRTIYVQRHPG